MTTTPDPDETARRLRDALQAEADTVQPSDAWSTITDRLDRKPSPWAWITQHPVLTGGAVALVLVLGFLAVTQLGGDDETQVEVVDDPPPSEDYSLVAATVDGRLVELDRDGTETGVLIEDFATDADGESLLAGPTLAVPPPPQYALGDDVFYLERQPGQEDCYGPVGGLQFAPIDGQDYDRDPSPIASPVGNFAYSLDGRQVAYETASPVRALGEGEPCSDEAATLVIEGRVAGEGEIQLDVPDGRMVTALHWQRDGQLLVLLRSEWDTEPTIREAYLIDPSGVAGFGDPLPVDVPWIDVAAASAIGDDGYLVVAGSGWAPERSPFAEEPPGVLMGSGDVHVWRGSLGDGDGELLGTVSLRRDFVEKLSIDGYNLLPLAVEPAPDGSVYVTVSNGVGDPTGKDPLSGEAAITDPADVALFRITPDGETQKLAEGIVSVAIRAGEPEPQPPADDDAGPVVGARADGSLALLDPATGEVVEEFGPPEATDPSQGLAVAADGSVYYPVRSGAGRTIDCANDETSVREFIWRGVLDGESWLVSAPFPRGRMPTPSPDGSQLAFVSTSNGEICDGALVVHVGDVATEQIVATHTLPVGVEPTQLLWGASDELVIMLPAGDDVGGPPEVNLVSVDPLVSGPVSMGGEPLSGRYRIAPGAAQGLVTVLVAEDGTATVATRSDATSDAIAPPAWSVEIPGEGARLPVSLAEDRAGTVWVTFAEGEPGDERYGESFTTWRLPVVDGEPGEPEQVSDELVAVAATPFPSPGETEEPTATTTDAVPTTDRIDEAGGTAPYPGILYVAADGRLYHRAAEDESGFGTFLADGFTPQGAYGRVPVVDPDGTAAYLTRWEPGAGLCESDIVRVGLPGSPNAGLGAVEVLVEGAAEPTISPDGAKLAYLDLGEPQGGRCTAGVVVVDTETGQERRWAADEVSLGRPDYQDPVVTALVWSTALQPEPQPGPPTDLTLQWEDGSGAVAGFSWLPLDAEVVVEGSTGWALWAGDVTSDPRRLVGADGGVPMVVAVCLPAVPCPLGPTAAQLPDSGIQMAIPSDTQIAHAAWGPSGLLALVPCSGCVDGAYDLVHLQPGEPLGSIPQMDPSAVEHEPIATPIALDTPVLAAAWLP